MVSGRPPATSIQRPGQCSLVSGVVSWRLGCSPRLPAVGLHPVCGGSGGGGVPRGGGLVARSSGENMGGSSRSDSSFFFFFCNTSPKPQLQCSQEASPIYIESPTSPSQGSAGRQAGVTAAAGRCKVVNYATKWTSQKWSPHTPRPGAVADNLGVLSGRVPVLSGYPIIRGKHWYIGRETRGSSGGGGGWQWATGARWVAHRGKKKMAFHSHGVGVGVGVPWEGQPSNGWR